MIGLQKTDGGDLSVKELGDTFQSLDLWEGVLTSRFKLSGSPVEITTLCHPDVDGLAYKLKSSLFVSEKLGVQIRFPYPSAAFGGDPTTFDKKDSHRSEVIEKGKNYWVIKHQIDDFVYYCRLQTSGEAILKETVILLNSSKRISSLL